MSKLKKIDEDFIIKHLDGVYKTVNDHFKYDLRKETWIGGGAIASLASGEVIRDYDFFFISEHALAKFIAIIKVVAYEYRETENAFTFILSNDNNGYQSNFYQFIKLHTGDPKQEVTKFDFYHSMNYYHDSNLFIKYPNVIKNRELVYNYNCRNPNGSPARYRKFIKRGYIPNSNCAHFILRSLDLKKPLVDTYSE